MQIGRKIKSLRLKKGLTQGELGERTDLSKGFISQLERDMNSPSIETLFHILEVLGVTPKEFFDDDSERKAVYTKEDRTVHIDEEQGYKVEWLIPESNEKDMEPVYMKLKEKGQFKRFDPSPSETFIYVLSGKVRLILGDEAYIARAGESIYFEASDHHQLFNADSGDSEVLLVATHSYL